MRRIRQKLRCRSEVNLLISETQLCRFGTPPFGHYMLTAICTPGNCRLDVRMFAVVGEGLECLSFPLIGRKGCTVIPVA